MAERPIWKGDASTISLSLSLSLSSSPAPGAADGLFAGNLLKGTLSTSYFSRVGLFSLSISLFQCVSHSLPRT